MTEILEKWNDGIMEDCGLIQNRISSREDVKTKASLTEVTAQHSRKPIIR